MASLSRRARHGFATFLSFAIAGAVPLLPFAFGMATYGFAISVALTFLTLFIVGALRARVTVDRWFKAGLEMLLLGLVVAIGAYGSGLLVAHLLAGG